MLSKKSFLIIVALILLSGCATIKGRKQIVKVVSDVEGAEIYVAEKKEGVTPGFIEIPRGKTENLIIKQNDKAQVIKLEKSYRWRDSFFPNLTLGVLTPGVFPVWFLVDYFTGAMWEYEKLKPINFSGNKNETKSFPSIIAIAPPKDFSELRSDEVAEFLQKYAQDKYPKSQIKSYEGSAKHFSDYEYSYSKDVEFKYADTLYYSLGATHLLRSEVKETGSKLEIATDLYDVFREKSDDSETLIVEKDSLQFKDDGYKLFFKDRFADLVPNAIGIERTTPYSYIWAARQNYAISEVASASRSYHYVDKNIFGPLQNLTVTNIYGAKTHDRYNWFARWRTSGNLSYWNYVDDGTRDELSLLQMGAGIGPEAGLEFPLGSAFLNLIPKINYLHMEYDWGGHHTSNGLVLSYAFEIGYMLNLSERWQLKLFTNVSVFDDSFFKSSFHKAYNDENLATASFSGSSGLAVFFHFPEGREQTKKAIRKMR